MRSKLMKSLGKYVALRDKKTKKRKKKWARKRKRNRVMQCVSNDAATRARPLIFSIRPFAYKGKFRLTAIFSLGAARRSLSLLRHSSSWSPMFLSSLRSGNTLVNSYSYCEDYVYHLSVTIHDYVLFIYHLFFYSKEGSS